MRVGNGPSKQMVFVLCFIDIYLSAVDRYLSPVFDRLKAKDMI